MSDQPTSCSHSEHRWHHTGVWMDDDVVAAVECLGCGEILGTDADTVHYTPSGMDEFAAETSHWREP